MPEIKPMKQHLGSVTFLVREYNEAIAFFTGKLGFALVEDTVLDGGKRWVRVAPHGLVGSGLLLAQATSVVQRATVGAQAGDRVFLFLETDDFPRDYEAMVAAGVEFAEKPRYEPYGTVAVFRDLYGNKWDLLQQRHPN
jgi:catechol 2,3-dioxygenase-like lactoylglutathione lyase family enzyme